MATGHGREHNDPHDVLRKTTVAQLPTGRMFDRLHQAELGENKPFPTKPLNRHAPLGLGRYLVDEGAEVQPRGGGVAHDHLLERRQQQVLVLHRLLEGVQDAGKVPFGSVRFGSVRFGSVTSRRRFLYRSERFAQGERGNSAGQNNRRMKKGGPDKQASREGGAT